MALFEQLAEDPEVTGVAVHDEDDVLIRHVDVLQCAQKILGGDRARVRRHREIGQQTGFAHHQRGALHGRPGGLVQGRPVTTDDGQHRSPTQ